MNGVIVVNKPEGFTSFDAVAVLRKLSRQKKIGHCGTLDPNATGVLPLLLGRASKAQDILPDRDKTYKASFRLGVVTDTLDVWGEVIKEEKTSVTEDELLGVLSEFTGEVEQIPPMYSAVKVDGKRLYDLARQGIEVERKSRKITVYSIELLSFCEERQEGEIRVVCSKGTYIRTLIDDIAKRFSVGGCMTSLVRETACGFTLSDAHSLDELKALAQADKLSKVLLSTESLFAPYGEVMLSTGQAKRFANGGALSIDRIRGLQGAEDGILLRVKDSENRFLGLGRVALSEGELKPFKQFSDYSELS
ncbi:MAG: tRNA pseudouridine(55) synthase TruB [Ruminococcus sp.]